MVWEGRSHPEVKAGGGCTVWAGGFLACRGRKGRGCRGALGIQGKFDLSSLLTALHTRGTLEPEV